LNFGEFYNTDSVVHKLDPRLKLCFMLFFMTEIFFIKKNWVYIFVLLILCVRIKLSGIPVKIFINNLKSVLILIIFTGIINMCFSIRGNIIFKFYFLKITDYGLDIMIKSVLRLIILIIITALVMLSTSTMRMTNALVEILMPFKKIFRLPINEIAMIITIALRFVPVLSEEFNLIIKAQRARGMDFNSKSLTQKIKNYIALLVPMFVLSFNRAEELSLAMEARCYDPKNTRTNLNKFKFSTIDWWFIACVIIFHVIIFCVLCI